MGQLPFNNNFEVILRIINAGNTNEEGTLTIKMITIGCTDFKWFS